MFEAEIKKSVEKEVIYMERMKQHSRGRDRIKTERMRSKARTTGEELLPLRAKGGKEGVQEEQVADCLASEAC